MKILLRLLFIAITGACSAAVSSVTGPRFDARLICFIGPIDSRSSCAGDLSKSPATGINEGWWGVLTCGNPNRVSEVRWKFLRRDGDSDVYVFERKFPVSDLNPRSATATIRFKGQREVIFKDTDQVVVIDPSPHAK